MKKQLFLASIMVMLTALVSTAVAQTPGPPAGGSDRNLRDSTGDVKGRSNEIERIGREAEKVEPSASTTTTTTPNFPQIKEDFERLQLINADVLQPSASSGAPAYDRISEAATEMKNRATRLKSNLFPAKSGKHPKENPSGAEDQDLKTLLLDLDNAVGDFTHSPIFQNTGVVNPEDSTNAQKELEKVIKLSTRIKLEADRMKKVNSPTP